MKNLHWAVTAYNEKEGDRLPFSVVVQVRHCDNEDEALKRAKEVINERKHYYVRSVIECECSQHNLQHRNQLETMREYTKLLKKQLPSDDDEYEVNS